MSLIMRRTAAFRRNASTPPATTVVSDNFDRADTTGSLGTAPTGQTWQTPIVATGFGIATNTAASKSVTANNVAVVDSAVSDCAVQADVTAGATTAGVVWRDTDGNNHFVLTTSAGKIFRKSAGTYTAVATLASATGIGTYKIVLSGSVATIFKNGAQIGTYTDTFNQTATRHGIYSGASNAPRYDNFTVTQ